MADEKENVDSSRVSVRFMKDNQPYNAGESAVFNEKIAAHLVSSGQCVANKHAVKNDTNLMALIKGQNNDDSFSGKGMTEEKIAELIDKKLDDKLKPLMDALNKNNGAGPQPPLSPAVRK